MVTPVDDFFPWVGVTVIRRQPCGLPQPCRHQLRSARRQNRIAIDTIETPRHMDIFHQAVLSEPPDESSSPPIFLYYFLPPLLLGFLTVTSMNVLLSMMPVNAILFGASNSAGPHRVDMT